MGHQPPKSLHKRGTFQDLLSMRDTISFTMNNTIIETKSNQHSHKQSLLYTVQIQARDITMAPGNLVPAP